MKYLSQEACIIAVEAIHDAIKRMERNIETCGKLCGGDAKLDIEAVQYFRKQLKANKADIESLRRLAAELKAQGWEAYRPQPQGDGV